MALREEFEVSGNWLFRWRSYLPLILIGIFLFEMRTFEPPGDESVDFLWEILCLTVSLFGFFIRILVIGHAPAGTSGRNTSRQIANQLNTTGMYSVVRHPLYLGNFLIWLGVSMFLRTVSATFLIMLLLWIYYERIMFAEEEFLRKAFGDRYLNWAEATPAFLPNVRLWKTPDLKFSFKHVLKREYSGLFAILGSFTFLEIIGDFVAEGTLGVDPIWQFIFMFGLISYLVLITLKKKTKILHVQGR